MKVPNKSYLLLGSNIEPRFHFLKRAIGLIEKQMGVLISVSSVYESEPWGFHSKVNFLNCVVLVESKLTASEMLQQIIRIEEEIGRVRRGVGYTSRKIDIDILYFNHDMIDLPDLKVPHPRLHERKFTLIALAEIAPELVHPLLERTNKELLEKLDDPSEVVIFNRELKINEV